MTTVKEHLPGYQERDYEIVDYQMFPLPSTNLWFRGPQPKHLDPDHYFTCIGAAQTLGCFCHKPYPTLLENQLGMTALNLGYGGAGPYFFIKHQGLLEYVNKSRFVIVQVMSGRSESNSLFDSGGLEYLTRRSDGIRLGANAAYSQLLRGEELWRKLPYGQRYWRWIGQKLREPKFKKIVAETRQNWVSNYLHLFNQIKVPIILLWFSTREIDYQDKYHNVSALFNKFPQLVNSGMVEDIKNGCDLYTECVTNRGMPQPLISRFTGEAIKIDTALDREDLGGELWTHNDYYPSPEMHEDAAAQLSFLCHKYLP